MASIQSSDLLPISEIQKAFLRPFLPHNTIDDPQHNENIQEDKDTLRAAQSNKPQSSADKKIGKQRPFVTLTYACSLDSKIAIQPGAQTKLSGPLSKSMTHYLRKHHDAILVGVNTVLADDPSLNCRYPGAGFDHQPRPVVVDPTARWDPSVSKVMKLFHTGQGKQPMIVKTDSAGDRTSLESSTKTFAEVFIPSSSSSSLSSSDGKAYLLSGMRISWANILQHLYTKEGIESIMIEGGATIINQLLSEPGLVDSVIITIAPTFLGDTAVEVSPASTTNPSTAQPVNAADLESPAWQQFGNDMVLCGRLKRHEWSPVPSYNLP